MWQCTIKWANSQRCLQFQIGLYLVTLIVLMISQCFGITSIIIEKSSVFKESGFLSIYICSNFVFIIVIGLTGLLFKAVANKSLSLVRWYYILKNSVIFLYMLMLRIYFQQIGSQPGPWYFTTNATFRWTIWFLHSIDMLFLQVHITEMEYMEIGEGAKSWKLLQNWRLDRIIFLQIAIYIIPFNCYAFIYVYQIIIAYTTDLPDGYRAPWLISIYASKSVLKCVNLPIMILLYRGVKQRNSEKIILAYKLHFIIFNLAALFTDFRGDLEYEYLGVQESIYVSLGENQYYILAFLLHIITLSEFLVQLQLPPKDPKIKANARQSQEFIRKNEIFLKSLWIGSKNLEIIDKESIGSGQFSDVYKAIITTGRMTRKRSSVTFRKTSNDGEHLVVAVKILKSAMDSHYGEALMEELKMLKNVGNNEHLVHFYGCWITNEYKIGIVLEFCEMGALLNYLRNRDNEDYRTAVSREELLRFSKEIAQGMEYLSSKRVIHADLAARNVLLDRIKKIKICDFGMSLHLYYYQLYATSPANAWPWKWMAPESLTDLKFSTKTDVWSFAILLWEIFTLGEVPFAGHDWTSDFVHEIQAGLRPAKPYFASDQIFEIMNHCWKLDSAERPSFTELVNRLKILHEDKTATEIIMEI